MNVMVDLETMGLGASPAVVAIGAVVFSSERVLDEMYVRVSLEDSVQRGLRLDASTVLWWMAQGDRARLEITAEGAYSLPAALIKLRHFVEYAQVERLWGNGAASDNVWLRSAYQACGLTFPVGYRGDRCYRTLRELDPAGALFAPPAVPHHALHDARAQAEHLLAIGRAIPAVKEMLA